MKKIILMILLLSVLFIAGCGTYTKVSELSKTENINKEVVVRGEVSNTFKFGSLSGYKLVMEDGEIFVNAKKLPEEGKTTKVKGILLKGLIGYYVQAIE